MILHRAVMQQNREIKTIEAPSWFANDPIAQRYEALFGELAWKNECGLTEEGRRRGRLGHPLAAYLRSYLVMVEEKIESMPKLRQYLCEHPALVWVVDYRLVSDASSPYGFAVEASVPSAGHLGVVLRRVKDDDLAALLTQSAQRVLTEDTPSPSVVVLDVKHQYAYVRQNNAWHPPLERFDPARPPRGDTDCRLGFKATTNQSGGTDPHPNKGEYLWGYGSGIAVVWTSTKEGVVLADMTLPFNVNDVTFAPTLLEATIARLKHVPEVLIADAAFDAQCVYAYFLDSHSTLAIPLNSRGHPTFRWTADGQPCCPKDSTPMVGGAPWQERGQPRQAFRCPTCGHTHKLFIDPIHRVRWQLDRSSPAFKRLYRQRTVVERVNSLADTYKLTHPRLRRQSSVAHRNSFIYIVLNLHVLQRLRQQRKDTIVNSLYAAAA